MVIGLEVEDIVAAREELLARGAEFATGIEELEGESVKWTYFLWPDGQFYSLHEHEA